MFGRCYRLAVKLWEERRKLPLCRELREDGREHMRESEQLSHGVIDLLHTAYPLGPWLAEQISKLAQRVLGGYTSAT
jgi:hypothetical protein